MMAMKRQSLRRTLLAATATAAMLAMAGQALADDGASLADELGQAVTQGTPSIQVRPRYEVVQQQNKAEAQAATVQTLVGYSTKPLDGFGATVQFIDVSVLNSTGNYNVPAWYAQSSHTALAGNHPRYANIADPAGDNVNQAFLSYEGYNTRLAAGRQIIQLDDERFVGNVGFRQNMQTFDAVSVVNKSLPDIKVFGAYLWGLKDIENQEVSQNSYLTEANWTKFKALQVDAFGYWYGNESDQTYAYLPGAAGCYITTTPGACNSATLGGRLHGSFDLPAAVKLAYVGELAHQGSYDGGSGAIDADYSHGGAKVNWHGFGLAGDYMVMGSNNGLYGFQTPLATKHAFNGWAEMFLTTPKEGLRSAYGTATAKVFGVDLLARYYSFRSDYQNKDLGHEWDLSATYPLNQHINGGVQFAKYHASNGGFADTSTGGGTLANTDAMWAFVTVGF
ncbi:hypothetical protein GALL_158740 [mine drainage metagenome]|uniref:Alginate export domain-containing protein n=1 Tax=mine drainage metagenome TaxID=410659 RepID=A0A1J5SD87_9ZZZZ